MKKTNKQTNNNNNNNKNGISTSPFISAYFSLYLLVQVVFYVFSSKGKKIEVEVERKFVWIYMVRQSV